MYNHQDWSTVVLKKPQKAALAEEKQKSAVPVQHANQAKNSVAHSASSKPAWKIEQQVDDETNKSPLDFVTSEVAKKIIQGRINMKLSQKDLANRLNMQEREIKDIETCKAVENKAILSKIKRFLNIVA